jgi:hypothetical protein
VQLTYAGLLPNRNANGQPFGWPFSLVWRQQNVDRKTRQSTDVVSKPVSGEIFRNGSSRPFPVSRDKQANVGYQANC